VAVGATVAVAGIAVAVAGIEVAVGTGVFVEVAVGWLVTTAVVATLVIAIVGVGVCVSEGVPPSDKYTVTAVAKTNIDIQRNFFNILTSIN
jgi:hypothetical protein